MNPLRLTFPEQVFTGHPPFLKNHHAAMVDIMNGKRPQRPENLNHDGLWKLIVRCWNRIQGSDRLPLSYSSSSEHRESRLFYAE
jgi:hypothetical protein